MDSWPRPGDAGVDTNRTTQLTFSKPFSLPGVTLGAGTYIFERAARSRRSRCQCRADRRFVYYMGFTELVEKPRGIASPVTFGEAKAGSLSRREWYPRAVNGHRFLYR